jgi:hypothetical protein
MVCNFISLVLQAVGGPLAATHDAGDPFPTCVDIMIAGLAFQVVSLTISIALSMEFVYRARRVRKSNLDFDFSNLRIRIMFRVLPYATAVITITIYIRCAFRVVELKDGFGGKLANDQTTFIISEGPMIIIATIALTVCHTAIAFCSASSWAPADWTWMKSIKRDNNYTKMVSQETATPSVAGSEVIEMKTQA